MDFSFSRAVSFTFRHLPRYPGPAISFMAYFTSFRTLSIGHFCCWISSACSFSCSHCTLERGSRFALISNYLLFVVILGVVMTAVGGKVANAVSSPILGTNQCLTDKSEPAWWISFRVVITIDLYIGPNIVLLICAIIIIFKILKKKNYYFVHQSQCTILATVSYSMPVAASQQKHKVLQRICKMEMYHFHRFLAH